MTRRTVAYRARRKRARDRRKHRARLARLSAFGRAMQERTGASGVIFHVDDALRGQP